MYFVLSWIVAAIYLALPVAGILWIARLRCWRRRVSVLLALGVGAAMGVGLVASASTAMGTAYPLGQYLLTAYLGAAMLLLLKLFDLAVTRGMRWLVGWRSHRSSLWRGGVIMLGRMAMFALIAIPWLLAAMMTYRPRSGAGDDPMQMLQYPFERVQFRATDGRPLVGWFIPALGVPSHKTVLICHGLGASKSNFLPMASGFVPFGYNVFIFDFRAHGESTGQITSFGDAETQDVAGAIQYLKNDRHAACESLHALGISMGGAALLAAVAGDESTHSQIDSVCVISTFDSFANEAHDMLEYRIHPLAATLLERVGGTFAAMHAGRNLPAFAPAQTVDRLWPTPLLLIHGEQDPLIPQERGRALYDHAVLPKQAIFVPQGDHMNLLTRSDILGAIRDFFDHARRVPVI